MAIDVLDIPGFAAEEVVRMDPEEALFVLPWAVRAVMVPSL